MLRTIGLFVLVVLVAWVVIDYWPDHRFGATVGPGFSGNIINQHVRNKPDTIFKWAEGSDARVVIVNRFRGACGGKSVTRINGDQVTNYAAANGRRCRR